LQPVSSINLCIILNLSVFLFLHPNKAMKSLTINHYAVWGAYLIQQGVELAWYGVFRNKWMQLLAKQAIEFEGTSALAYVISLLGGIASCYVTAWIFQKLQIDTAWNGILVAALLWLGYTFFSLAQTDLFALRPIQLSLINGGGILANAVVCGAMLGAWKKYETE
jgi:predicted nicotinamide N-methyase